MVSSAFAAAPGTFTLRIAVDQFGYLSDMSKVAVISNPQEGFNAAESYTPAETLEVRRWGSDEVVFSGPVTAWNGGATHAQSGDKAWWFDFSDVRAWGEYYIYDPANDTRSSRFRVDYRAYEDVLKQAVRVFYYQRRGFPKSTPHADTRWTDTASFLGSLQDTECRLVTNPTAASERDLRGGWYDAGDYNKYVTWAANPISEMLLAFEHNSINGSDFMGGWNVQSDLYRAYMRDASYHWGNNSVKCRTGSLFALQRVYGLNPSLTEAYYAAAGGQLHYIHGVNSLPLVYLSNMYEHGADHSANEMYHSWFANGTIYDNALTSPNGPAPGYLTGGANKNFAPDPSYSGPPLIPPMGQPVQESYKDWNTSWPENSWELTEPAISYQGAYVYLLSRFARPLSYLYNGF